MKVLIIHVVICIYLNCRDGDKHPLFSTSGPQPDLSLLSETVWVAEWTQECGDLCVCVCVRLARNHKSLKGISSV